MTETNEIQIIKIEKLDIDLTNDLIDLFNHLYKHITSIHKENITPSNIVILATELIQLVEKYQNLTGNQKKMLVINIIKKYVNEQNGSEDDKKALNLIIDLTLPNIIDNLIKAINGEINFNRAKSFFSKFICCK